MGDATGHRDRPGTTSTNCAQITMNGLPTNYYWFDNPQTSSYEVVKANPAGKRDEVVAEFPSMAALQNWVNEEWNRGQLR